MDKLINLKNLENCWSCYKLTCKNTPDIVYIGITNEEYIIARLFRHFTESVSRNRTKNEEKHEWIRNNWKDIELTILESNITSEQEATKKEANYIFNEIKSGFHVLNKTYSAITLFNSDGSLYKHYPSYQAAADELAILPSRLMQATNRKERVLGKYIVKKYDPNVSEIIPDFLNKEVHRYEPIIQFDKNGNYVREWDSANICCQELGIDRSRMSKCLRDFNKTSKNFRFKFKNIESNSIIYKVYMYDSNNNLIEKFKTAVDCAQYMIDNNLSSSKLSSLSGSIGKAIKNNTLYLNHFFRNE